MFASQDDIKCYILVNGHTEGMALHEWLRKNDFPSRVAPAPREAKSACGMSLLVDCLRIDEAIDEAAAAGLTFKGKFVVEQTFDTHRDKYC